jgi:hypothetical protein
MNKQNRDAQTREGGGSAVIQISSRFISLIINSDNIRWKIDKNYFQGAILIFLLTYHSDVTTY